jgi:hypothetical protein
VELYKILDFSNLSDFSNGAGRGGSKSRSNIREIKLHY